MVGNFRQQGVRGCTKLGRNQRHDHSWQKPQIKRMGRSEIGNGPDSGSVQKPNSDTLPEKVYCNFTTYQEMRAVIGFALKRSVPEITSMENGVHFYSCDFQVHTPRDLQ